MTLARRRRKKGLHQVCMDGPMEPAAAAQVAVLPTGGKLPPCAEIFLSELGACHQTLGIKCGHSTCGTPSSPEGR